MAHVTLTLDEYEALRSLISSERESEGAIEEVVATKAKRKPTAANRRYAAAFEKSLPRFMKKNGGWKKNGFRNCSRAAHKLCK